MFRLHLLFTGVLIQFLLITKVGENKTNVKLSKNAKCKSLKPKQEV